MPLEQRTFISPNDILAVEYDCPHCKARLLTPLEKFARVLAVCRVCGKEVISETHKDASKSADAAVVHDFLVTLKELQDRRLIALRLEIPSE